MWSTDEEDSKQAEWDWETPDLMEGSPWHHARLSKLKKVKQDLETRDNWYQEGLAGLNWHIMLKGTNGRILGSRIFLLCVFPSMHALEYSFGLFILCKTEG